jgi:hypothetical protein
MSAATRARRARAEAGGTRSATAPRAPRFTLDAAATPDNRLLFWLGWLVIAAYGVAVAAMAIGPHQVGDVFTETDFYGAYGPGARMLQRGILDPARYTVVGPVFEVVLAGVGFLVGDLFVAAEVISGVAMVVALGFWHSLVARRLGAFAALLVVAFMATNPQFFRYGWAVTTDALALALQAAAIWTLFGAPDATAEGRITRRMFVAGLLAAFAFLTRYNSIALLPAGLLVLAFGWNGLPVGERARHAFFFLLGFLAPVVPWIAWSATHGGAMRFQLHHNIAYEVFARPKGIVWDVYAHEMEGQFPTPWSVIARDPVAVVSRMLFNVGDHVRLDALKLIGLPLAAAAVAGFVLAWRGRVLGRLTPMLVTGAFLFLSLVPAFHSERYSMAVLPIWALLAAWAFASPKLALSAGGVWLKLPLVPVILLSVLTTTRAFAERTVNQLPVEARDAAEKVRPFLRPGDKVMARKPHFAWYAGLQALTLPLSDSLSQWADAGRRMGARWLYFSWPEAEMRPRFEWLLDTTSAAPGLTVRAATQHWPAVVYEIGPDFGREPDWLTNDTLAAVHRARARVLTDDHNVQARVFLAMHEFSARNHEAAQVWIDQLLRLHPEDPEVLMLAAENRLQLQDPDGAMGYFERYERLRPGSAEAQVGRGWVAALRGDERLAAQLWAPVAGATEDVTTLRRMGVAFARTGDMERLALVRERLVAIGAPQ